MGAYFTFRLDGFFNFRDHRVDFTYLPGGKGLHKWELGLG